MYFLKLPRHDHTPSKERKKINSFTQSFKLSGKYKGEKPDFTIYRNLKR